MTPKEKFNKEVLEVLQSIEEEELVREKGNPIKYDLPTTVGVGSIPKKRRQAIFYKLQEWEAIKILSVTLPDWKGSGRHIVIYQVQHPKFDEVYKKFQPRSGNKHFTETAEWSEDFRWEGNNFVFGELGSINFKSDVKISLFNALVGAKGGWVTIRELKKITEKDEKSYIRPTIGHIENDMSPKIKKHINIPSTRDDNLSPKPQSGAYRIKYQP